MKEHRRFYDDGIRFQCQGDGKCCVNHGRHLFVYVGFNDRRRLAVHLGMSVPEFTKQYASAHDGMVHLKDPERDCPFFRDNRCSVHEARPWQCRTWPFWPENMHPRVWEREVASFCPGVGKGKLYTAEEIRAIMEKRGEVGGCGEASAECGVTAKAERGQGTEEQEAETCCSQKQAPLGEP